MKGYVRAKEVWATHPEGREGRDGLQSAKDEAEPALMAARNREEEHDQCHLQIATRRRRWFVHGVELEIR